MSKVYSFRNEPETLTIVDLAGPIIDPTDRCILLVHDQRHFGRGLHAWPGIYRSFAASQSCIRDHYDTRAYHFTNTQLTLHVLNPRLQRSGCRHCNNTSEILSHGKDI